MVGVGGWEDTAGIGGVGQGTGCLSGSWLLGAEEQGERKGGR